MITRRHLQLLCLPLLLLMIGTEAATTNAVPETTLIETYGQDYLTYRKARQAEADGLDSLAADGYGRIYGSGMLSDAAKVYQARCLMRLKRLSEAEELLEARVQQHASGLYTFEAHLLLAQLRYLKGSKGDAPLASAQGVLAQALHLYPNLAEANQEQWRRRRNLPALLLLLKDETPAEKAKEDFGVDTPFAMPGSKEWPGPERIINRDTCEWYLPWIHSQLQLFGAFLSLSQQDLQAAQKYLSAARAALPAHNQAVEAYLERQTYCLQRGGWLYPPELRERFDDLRPHLQLGAYLLINDQPADAKPLLELILDHRRARESEQAGAVYALCICTLKLQGSQQAAELLKQHEKLLRKADLYDSLHFLSQLNW